MISALLYQQPVSFRAGKNDLSFINRIRDRNVSRLDSLQKDKIETLLKFRDVKKVIEQYRAFLASYSRDIPVDILNTSKKDLGEMEQFLEVLKSKLHEINLSIIEEEEKNY